MFAWMQRHVAFILKTNLGGEKNEKSVSCVSYVDNGYFFIC